MEGRGGRRRSRSFAGPGSPRLAAASPSQAIGSSGGSGGASSATTTAGKRKRSGSSAAVSPGTRAMESPGESEAEPGNREDHDETQQQQQQQEQEQQQREEDDAAERDRKAEEDHEATIAAARPALILCRVVDALQSALKSGQGGPHGDTAADKGSAAAAAAAAAAEGVNQGTLQVYLSGGDDFLLAASRSAFEAYEQIVKPLGQGGGTVEILEAMGLKEAFARQGAGVAKDRGEQKGDKEVASDCRERILNLLCEGELFAVSGSRS